MTTRPHGTRARYVFDWCRCPACRRANTDYQRRWGSGRRRLVDATKTRARLAELRAAGMGLRRIAAGTGVTYQNLEKIANGRRRHVRPETARAVARLLRGPRQPTPRPFAAAPLLEALRGDVSQLQRMARASGSTVRYALRNGLTEAQADRWAVRCGFHPGDVWPTWWEAVA